MLPYLFCGVSNARPNAGEALATANLPFERRESIQEWLMRQMRKEYDVVKDTLFGREIPERKDVIAVLQEKQELLQHKPPG